MQCEIVKRFRVISSSFFGQMGSKYAEGILENLKLIQVSSYPGIQVSRIKHLRVDVALWCYKWEGQISLVG